MPASPRARLSHAAFLIAALALAATLFSASAARRAPAAPAAGLLPFYSVREEIMTAVGSPAAADPVSGRVYAVSGPGIELKVVDTQQAAVVHAAEFPFVPDRLALSGDGSRLFLAQDPPDNELTGQVAVVNTATMDLLKTFTFTCPLGEPWVPCYLSGMAAGPEDRLYLTYIGWRMVDIHDATTGAQLLRFSLSSRDGIAALAARGNALYTLQTPYQADSRLRRFNISGLTPALVDEAAVAATGALQVAPDGSFLIIGGADDYKAVQVDAATLAVTRAYEAHGEYVYFKSVIPSSNSDEVVLLYGYTPPDVRTVIEAHDAATGALLRVAEYQMGPGSPEYYFQRALYALPRNQIAHHFSDRLQVLQPLDYAAAVPVALAGFCGGPVFDDFSNPASGWPVADLGAVAYRYDRDQYSILQRETNRWSAVSRGDLWIDGEAVQVRTWLPAKEGMSGLVFGLNGDWTHFYTFEVIPHLHAWVVFFYQNGWHLWGLEQSGAVQGVGHSNTLTIDFGPSGTAYLKVNGTTVFSLPDIPDGRIGLSGGSFDEPEMDARFDDYLFVGRNCSRNGRAGTLDRSPLLPRLSLESVEPAASDAGPTTSND